MAVDLKDQARESFEIMAAHHGGYLVMVPHFGGESRYMRPALYAGSLEHCLAFIRENIVSDGAGSGRPVP